MSNGMRKVAILCGNGGIFLPHELERGADGANTGYAYPEMLVQLVKLIKTGERAAAHDLFDRHLPLLRYEQQPGMLGLSGAQIHLKRRGAIASDAQRKPGIKLSKEGHRRNRIPDRAAGAEQLMRPDVRMAADIGGTFTDIVLDRGSERLTRKVLTTAQRPEEGVLEGARLVLADAGLHFSDIDVFIHGTTLATNAIIERRGARTALIATDGFRDTLDIANESRYDQYDLTIEKPKPLVPRALRFTVPERVDVHGKIRLALDEAAVTAQVARLKDNGIEAVAICFMHSYVNAGHEQRTAEILKSAMPGLSITLSCEVCPGNPRIRAHLDRGRQRLCAAADGRLSGAHGRGAARRTVPRRDLSRHLGRRANVDRYRAALSGAIGRVGTGRRRDLRRTGRGARGREEGAVVRHGRHHGEDLPDREFRAEFGARL
jgi:hypothetical protein